jgi:hypothetical protein
LYAAAGYRCASADADGTPTADLAVGAFEPHRRMDVVVAVQDEFDAAPLSTARSARSVSRFIREFECRG